jgi:hypothetical protein
VAASASCATVTPLTLAVGDVHTLAAAERQQLCLSAGATGGEFILIPFNSDTGLVPGSSPRRAHANVPLSIASTNAIAAAGPPLGASSVSGSGFGLGATNSPNIGVAFEQRLRRIERTELGPLMRARGRGGFQSSVVRAPGPISGIRGLPATPAVGTPISLNSNGRNGCTNEQPRGSRVAAVSNTAIVVVDSGAPAGGFTDAEYQSIAVTFDTLIFPLDTTAFGKPSDMDNNGRIVLFFTTAVNQLTPLSTPSTSGFIGGFFFARDLFPRVATATVSACATSNEGEMFYLPVVDPNGQFNVFFKDKAALLKNTIGTLAHEFQHLINAGRRIYVTTAFVDFMDIWLNEGMSHLAEELLYYRVTGFAPKQNLNLATVTGTQAKLDAVNAYQVQNLGRLSTYMKAPDINSPYLPNDSLATRGATWELLRYVLDLAPNPASTYLRAMIDSPISVQPVVPNDPEPNGIPIFNSVFGSLFGDITVAVRQQAIAQFFDDTAVPIDPKYSFPSWNFRSILPQINSNQFPLATKSLVDGSPAAFNLTTGGTGYARFGVSGNTIAGLTATSGGGSVPALVQLILIRTK